MIKLFKNQHKKYNNILFVIKKNYKVKVRKKIDVQ